jgi:carbon storage regulator
VFPLNFSARSADTFLRMLVLTRKLGEVIRIGTGVTVRILEVKGNQVRLGLEAPPDVKIFREEIYRAILKENEEAALDGPETMEDGATVVRRRRRPGRGGRGEGP